MFENDIGTGSRQKVGLNYKNQTLQLNSENGYQKWVLKLVKESTHK